MVKSFVYGVGINDADYAVTSTRGGKNQHARFTRNGKQCLNVAIATDLKK